MRNLLMYSIWVAAIWGCKKNVPAKGNDAEGNPAAPVVHIMIDGGMVKNDISSQYRGINITENWENQSYWNYPVSPTATINALKPNIIRFGNDDYFWSEPPYSGPKPRLIDYGPNEFLSRQTDIIDSDGIHFKNRIMNIDQFDLLCRATNSEPEIIIPYDRVNYSPLPGDNTTTKEDFLENAEQMVRYCNVVKGYHIKFWEIGNETFQSDHNITATQYGNDLQLFSQRMKAVDPTIKIMANGNGRDWFQTVLTKAAGYIDYINVSYYPPSTSAFMGYNYYMASDLTFGNESPISDALEEIYNTGNTGRIKLIVTEFNAAAFTGGPWADKNDLGHALVSFQIGMDLMNNPGIYFSSFWNLRWYYGDQPAYSWLPADTDPRTVFNAAGNQGDLNPNGQSLSLLYNNVFGSMVDAESDNQLIRAYACYDKNQGSMNVFLLNKDSAVQSVKIWLRNIAKQSGQGSVFSGTSDTDAKPSLVTLGDVTLAGDSVTLALKPVSITLIKLK